MFNSKDITGLEFLPKADLNNENLDIFESNEDLDEASDHFLNKNNVLYNSISEIAGNFHSSVADYFLDNSISAYFVLLKKGEVPIANPDIVKETTAEIMTLKEHEIGSRVFEISLFNKGLAQEIGDLINFDDIYRGYHISTRGGLIVAYSLARQAYKIVLNKREKYLSDHQRKFKSQAITKLYEEAGLFENSDLALRKIRDCAAALPYLDIKK